MDGLIDGWLNGWTDGWTDGQTDGWMDGRMDGRMDGWMDGWMDGGTIRLNVCLVVGTERQAARSQDGGSLAMSEVKSKPIRLCKAMLGN